VSILSARTCTTCPCRRAAGGAFRAAITERCLPALEARRPEILFVSAGFDAHREDPLANLKLVDEDFAWVTSQITTVAARRARAHRLIARRRLCAAGAGRSAIAHLRGLAEA
jgi:acetoin utilization deacetylase AcuC-like enzyme